MAELDGLPALYALNTLAEKLSSMGEWNRLAFTGLAMMEKAEKGAGVPIPRLCDLAAATDSCHVVDVFNDAGLGKFFVENDFLPEYDDLPDAAIEHLDYAKIGRERREAAGGVFLPAGQGYAERDGDIPQTFKAPDFPPKPDYTVLLELEPADGESRQAVTLKLPAAPEVVTAIPANTKIHCVDCRVPALASAIEATGSVQEACQAAVRLQAIPEKELPKYKALLEARGFSTLAEALNLCDRIEQYSFSPHIRCPEDVGEDELRMLLAEHDRELLLPHLNLRSYGKKMMERDNIMLTSYGAFSRVDGAPVRDEPEQKQADNSRGKRKRTKKRKEPSR